MNKMMIRPVLAKDAGAIASIYNHYIEHSTISFEEAPVSSDEMAQRIGKVLTANLPWLVNESDGQVTGYAYATKWSERSAYRFTAESTVYVAHTESRKGIGRSLYKALLSQLKSQSIHNVIAGIALPNEASERLHEQFNFRKSGEFRQIGYKFGRWINVAYWQLETREPFDGI